MNLSLLSDVVNLLEGVGEGLAFMEWCVAIMHARLRCQGSLTMRAELRFCCCIICFAWMRFWLVVWDLASVNMCCAGMPFFMQ